MAVLPTPPHLFAAAQQPQSEKQMHAPSTATVAAIAAGRNPSPPAPGRLRGFSRRISSTTAAELQRKSNPEKRANHNAIERARRESLNQRFVVLASKIPSISHVRRPSKSLIVNRALQFVADSLAREAMYRTMLVELHDRTRVLTEQLNDYRVANGLHNYLETVPDLVLPVALADVPKDKPTARIVGRKNSTASALDVDSFDLATDDLTIDEYDDGTFPIDDYDLGSTVEDLNPAVAFFPQPTAAPEPATGAMPALIPARYATVPVPVPASAGPYGTTVPAPAPAAAPVSAPTDVHGAIFFHHQPLAASPVATSPVSQPDVPASSPSTSPPLTNTGTSISFAPAPPTAIPVLNVDPLASFKMFPPDFGLPDVGVCQSQGPAAYTAAAASVSSSAPAPVGLLDWASFLGQQAYPSA